MMTKQVSINDLIGGMYEVNYAIASIKRHFTNLDEKLHKNNKLLGEDIAQELWIDICDEEKKLFYCSTFLENLKKMEEESIKDTKSQLFYDSIAGRYFIASEKDIKKSQEIFKTYVSNAIFASITANSLKKEDLMATYESLEEGFARYKDKVKLNESFDRLIDMFNNNKFLSAGMFCNAFDIECNNSYDYYIGNREKYHEWLSNQYKNYEQVVADSESLIEICDAVYSMDLIKKAIDNFEEEEKNNAELS